MCDCWCACRGRDSTLWFYLTNSTTPSGYQTHPTLIYIASSTTIIFTLAAVPPQYAFVRLFPVLLINGVRAANTSSSFLTYSSGLNITSLTGCSPSRLYPSSTFNCNSGYTLSINGAFFMPNGAMNVSTSSSSVQCQSIRFISPQLMTCTLPSPAVAGSYALDTPLRVRVSYGAAAGMAPVVSTAFFTMAPNPPVLWSAWGCPGTMGNGTTLCVPSSVVTLTGDFPSTAAALVRLSNSSFSNVFSPVSIVSSGRQQLSVMLPSYLEPAWYNRWLYLQVSRVTYSGEFLVPSVSKPLVYFPSPAPSVYAASVSFPHCVQTGPGRLRPVHPLTMRLY